ncbi:MAG: hypothetical protein KAQ88_00115, partial [Hyphomicrobiaceae bacterium]|nr:hypothetical protein [Hyphomicrobiaceae bacterium]
GPRRRYTSCSNAGTINMTKPNNALVRIDPELKEPLKKMAKEDGRSLANLVNFILRAHVAAKAKGKRK